MLRRFGAIQLCLLAFSIAACGLGESKKKGKRGVGPESLFDENADAEEVSAAQNSASGDAEEAIGGLSLADAYLKYVYPVVQENCSSCHIHTAEGTHPFAGDVQELAIGAASRLIGTKLSESRFYVKVSDKDLPHPSRDVAVRVLPQLEAALDLFFSSVASLEGGIVTSAVMLKDARPYLPQVNPAGFLIFEAEGMTVHENTKFQTILGVHSNGKAVGSIRVPNHPVSASARTFGAIQYTGDACSASQVAVTQPVHVDGGLGIAKYALNVFASPKGYTGLVNAASAFTVLPFGKAIGEMTDDMYKEFSDPDFSIREVSGVIGGEGADALKVTLGDPSSSAYIVIDEAQVDALLNAVVGLRNSMQGEDQYNYDLYLYGAPEWCIEAHQSMIDTPELFRTTYNQVWFSRLCKVPDGSSIEAQVANGLLDKVGQSNKLEIFDYVNLSSGLRTTGPTTLRRATLNVGGSNRNRYAIRDTRGFTIDSALVVVRGDAVGSANVGGNIHANQPASLDWFEDAQITPGVASFTFSVPPELQFADIKESDPIPFRQYYRSEGSFRARMKRLSDDSYIPLHGNVRCPTYANGEAWTHVGPTSIADNGAGRGRLIYLERGQTYTFEFLQIDENTVIDAFILVADTETNEHLSANPNINPTVLRQTFYGRDGNGVQADTYLLSWPVEFGEFTIEFVNRPGYYALENPIFYMNRQNQESAVSVAGFDFILNGNLSLADRSYLVDAVRVPGKNIAYGQVLIPKDLGLERDSLAVSFRRLAASSEPGTLPDYADSPALKGVACQRPDVFREKLWPLYREQKLVDRTEYRDWLQGLLRGAYPARYTPGDEDNAPELDLPEAFPTVYTCTTCHDPEHPFLQLNANDFLESCDKIIARTDLVRPELSFSLRGLRGQFNHPQLFYSMFDPWEGTELRKQPTGGESTMIYGPMLGPLGTNVLADIEAGLPGNNAADLYRQLTNPKKIGFTLDNVNESFSFEPITPLHALYRNNNLSTVQFNRIGNESVDDIVERHSTQHEAIVRKWIDHAFKEWVRAEVEARN